MICYFLAASYPAFWDIGIIDVSFYCMSDVSFQYSTAFLWFQGAVHH
uniref:Uncharacterized protein n=1 Tax=Anguilla anguilla TaxID=7936 RepID=A0A0E9VCP7_ANGAN